LLVKGATATALLECTGVWFAGGRFGLSWKVKQAIIHHLPQKMKDFAFIGFNGVAGGHPTTRQPVMDVEDDDEVFQTEAAATPRATASRTQHSAVAAVMIASTADDDEDAEAEVVPAVVASTTTVTAAVSSAHMDDDAEDMEPVPVPVRKPVIKKKVVTSAPKK
jgi:hypothetical protein